MGILGHARGKFFQEYFLPKERKKNGLRIAKCDREIASSSVSDLKRTASEDPVQSSRGSVDVKYIMPTGMTS